MFTKLLKNFWPVLLLLIVETVLFLTNYIPDTYLVGWDMLMPELNIKLNLWRGIFSLWQEYRGLGLLDGMAHASTIPHTLFIAFLSLFLKQSLIRYVFLHITHLAGGIGMFFLVKYLLNNIHGTIHNETNRADERLNGNWKLANGKSTLALFGSLFYMFNLGIIQQYYAPFEGFTIHFAALPILTLLTLLALQKPMKKHILALFLVAFFTATQGLVPTVYVAYLVLLSSILFFHTIFAFKYKSKPLSGANSHPHPDPLPKGEGNRVGYLPLGEGIKKTRLSFATLLHPLRAATYVLIIILAANAFWLIPYSYSAIYTPAVISNTKINQFSSEEVFYRNKAFGDLWNVLTLKGFMLDTIEIDTKTTQDVFILQQWKNHIQTLPYTLLSLVIILGMFIGIFHTIKGKNRALYPFLIPFAIAYFLLANNTPLLDQINTAIRTVFPVFGEAFRFPFTKFITVFTFCYTIFLTYGIQQIIALVERRTWNVKRLKKDPRFTIQDSNIKQRATSSTPFATGLFDICNLTFVIGIIFYLSLPAFTGYFTSPYVRISIPDEYFKLFADFSTIDPQKRVALLPVQSFWNWQYRTWQFRGSGFHWYGMSQPTLHRAFDPWSLYNEQFYNELSFSINTENKEAFTKTLSKYDVAYLILDSYMFDSLSKKPINFESLEAFLLSTNAVQKIKDYGKITVYKTKFATPWLSRISKNEVLSISPVVKFTKQDPNLSNTVQYYTASTEPSLVKPFPSFFTEKLQSDTTFALTETNNEFIITPKNFQADIETPQLTIPSQIESEFLIPVELRPTDNGFSLTPLYPTITINGKNHSYPSQPIVYPVQLKNPDRYEFSDIKHSLKYPSGLPIRSYLINNQTNTILVQQGQQTERVMINPSQFQTNAFTINLPQKVTGISVRLPKIPGPLMNDSVMETGKYNIKEMSQTDIGRMPYSFTDSNGLLNGVELRAKHAAIELTFYQPNLFHPASYLVHVTSTYLSGLPVNFYVDNQYSNHPAGESKLAKNQQTNSFILSKTEKFFQGYGFHFVVKSVGKETAAARITHIAYMPFPEQWLNSITITSRSAPTIEPEQHQAIPYRQYHPGLYVATMSASEDIYVKLSQAFDPGWKVYQLSTQNSEPKKTVEILLPFIFGREIKDYTTMNGWANSWLLNNTDSEDTTLVFMYLPYYLQYVGIIVTVISLPILVLIRWRK